MRTANEEMQRTLEKLKLLKPKNIGEIYSFNKPHMKIKLVIMTLCYLFLDETQVPHLFKKAYNEDDFWKFGKQHLLKNPNKLYELLMRPETKDSISKQRIKKVKEIIKRN